MDAQAPPELRVARAVRRVAAWGPGLLVMLADTDAGNVVTAAQAGDQWRYRLLPLILLLIPMLYMIQELTVRLGIATGKGHAELIRERFGLGWAGVALTSLAIATVGSLITEFTGIAGIGELYGVPRAASLAVAALALIAVTATGSYRRVERIALTIGVCEAAFLVVAVAAHPRLGLLAQDAIDIPWRAPGFLYLAAGIIGASFNPWMIFYQQSATVEKELQPADLRTARWDTAIGAVLTQLLTGAVLVAAAATIATRHGGGALASVGEISTAFAPLLGEAAGRAVFGVGVLGASLVAAIVSSLALAWGVGEIAGYRRALEHRPFAAPWFYGVEAACIIGAAALVSIVPDLVWLNIAAQVLNVLLLPLVIGFLLVLAARELPRRGFARRFYFRLVIAVSALVIVIGLVAVVGGLR